MAEISSNEKILLMIKVVAAFVFLVFAFTGVFFSIWNKNWNSVVWHILLELSCVCVIYFCKLYVKGQLNVKFSSSFFRTMKFVSMVLTIGCWGACIAYIVLAYKWDETFNEHSHYFAATVAFATGFWFLVLCFDCKKYEYLL